MAVNSRLSLNSSLQASYSYIARPCLKTNKTVILSIQSCLIFKSPICSGDKPEIPALGRLTSQSA